MEQTSVNEASLPDDIRIGFNWGAFWLSWVWGLANGVYISLIVFLLPVVWQIYLGLKGNQLAWNHRQFTDFDHFREVQRTWAKWGWIVAILTVLLTVIGIILAGGVAILGVAAWETGVNK